MYPKEIIFGLHLYEIMIGLGFFLCLLYFRHWSSRAQLSAKTYNLCVIGAVCAVIAGGGSAILFQAFYNSLESGGRFEVAKNTGATFFGGLIGGVAVFLAIYFLLGEYWLLQRGEAKKNFRAVSEIAAGSIAIAHGMGRLGCLFAGCCHGKITDAWYGIYHVNLNAKAIPTQLLEALFLFALAGFLTYRLKKNKKGNLALYLVAYSFWRFFLEYLRADDRGGSLVKFWSPSQLVAVLLFIVGAALLMLEAHWEEKAAKAAAAANGAPVAESEAPNASENESDETAEDPKPEATDTNKEEQK